MAKKIEFGILAVTIIVASVAVLLLQRGQTPYRPKATGSVTAPEAVTSSPPLVREEAQEIEISKPVGGGAITNGSKVIGKATTTNGTLTFKLVGERTGQQAAGSISLTAGKEEPFEIPINFKTGIVAGEQATLQISRDDGTRTIIGVVLR